MQNQADQLLKVVGFDPSLRNWGIATGWLNLGTMTLKLHSLSVTKPVLPEGKQVRQSSEDLEAAVQLTAAAVEAAKGANAIFVEVPVGSQSASAMKGYGVCIGVLGALRAGGIPFFEVTPTEVKVVATRKRDATKKEMIAWAMGKHPEAPWPMQTKKGVTSPVEGSAEHMADAVAAIYAGMTCNQFQQLLILLRGK